MTDENDLTEEDWDAISGKLEDGTLYAEEIRYRGVDLELDGPTPDSEVAGKIPQLLAEKHKETENDPLFNTDLRESSPLGMKEQTQRFSILMQIVRRYPIKVSDIETQGTRKSVASTFSRLRDIGAISVIKQHGQEYVYVPTHLGIKEVIGADRKVSKREEKESEGEEVEESLGIFS